MLITTSTNATTPAALPEGSFVRATLAPGPNVVVIDVNAAGGYVGQLAVKVAYGGDDGDLRAWPGEAIVATTGAFGLGASATGAWFATIPGPGYVYVVASALTSGQPEVTLRSGPGSQTGVIAPYSTRNESDSSGRLLYSGRALPGVLTSAAGWQVKKYVYDASGNLTQVLNANSGAFDQIYDNRALLSFN